MPTSPYNHKENLELRLLDLFADSIGWEFRVRGPKNELTDRVASVSHDLKMVQGQKYGAFPVSYCELTGKGPEEEEGGVK